jgi:UDP:flavonoid glycosyltransferase YjiC (YdhE family)
MIKVAMVVDSEQGHFFHTLQLAQELSKRGHQVAYWSFPEAERLVRAQGFEFQPIVATDSTEKPDGGRRLFGALIRGQLLDLLVNESRPDVFLTLSIFSTGALALRYRYRIPVVLVRTNLTLLSRQEACQLVVEDLMSMSTEPLELIQLVKRAGIKVKSLEELPACFLKMPEIAMISRKFERGEDGEEQGVYYVGGCVNVERSDVTFPLETISSDRKLIYCSSGSQPHLDWDMNVRLFQLVIDSVKRRRETSHEFTTSSPSHPCVVFWVTWWIQMIPLPSRAIPRCLRRPKSKVSR